MSDKPQQTPLRIAQPSQQLLFELKDRAGSNLAIVLESSLEELVTKLNKNAFVILEVWKGADKPTVFEGFNSDKIGHMIEAFIDLPLDTRYTAEHERHLHHRFDLRR